MNIYSGNRLWIGVLGSGAAVLLGSGVAAAEPDVVGQPFGDAVSALDEAGRTVVVGVVVGNDLPLEECIVTNAREVSAMRPAAIDEDYPQFYPDDSEIQLTVNCEEPPGSDDELVTEEPAPGDQ